MNKEILSNRLNIALEKRNIKQIELSRKTGISKSLINQYLSGRAIPRFEKLEIIAKTLGVNILWLLGWEIPMDINVEISTEEYINAFQNAWGTEIEYIALNLPERTIISDYRLLNDEGRKKAETYVSDLTTIPKYLEE